MCKIFHRLALRKYFSLATLPLCHVTVTSLYSSSYQNKSQNEDVMLPKKLETAFSEEKREYVVSF